MTLPSFPSKKGFTFLQSKKANPILKYFLRDAKSSIGFTLIELLIVMAIIAILISIGLASFRRAQQQATDGQRKADIEQIRGALEQFYADNNSYPANSSELEGPAPIYLRDLPHPPDDPVGDYCYQQTAGGQNYIIGDDLITDTGTSGSCNGTTYNYTLTAQD